MTARSVRTQHGGARLDRDVDRRVVVVEVALDQLERLDRDDRAAGGGGRAVLGLGRGRHPGQPSAVGADHRDRLGRQLDQDAPEGVAGALDVGGEDRPADQLPQVGRRDDVVARRGEVGHLGVEARVLARQLELGVAAADEQVVAVGLERPAPRRRWSGGSSRSASVGRITEPGCSTFMPRTRWRMPTSRSVAIRTEPSSGSATSLTFWRIGLGLRAGTTPLTIPNAASNPSRLHKAFMRISPPEP